MEVTESQYPWERQALAYLKDRLPDTEPYRAWSNFEFIAEDGSIYEVDLLVVSRYQVFLVEIKSRPGRLSGDSGTWVWRHEGRDIVDDNPLLLANRKAKKLKSLLQRQGAIRRHRVPFVEPVIFLSNPSLRCELSEAGRTGVYLGQQAEGNAHPDIVSVLSGERPRGRGGAGTGPRPIDRTVSKAFGRAMDQAGIRPSRRHRRVGDYELEGLLSQTEDGDGIVYQDWEAHHVRFGKSKRRVRVYPLALQSSGVARAERRRAAEREFQLLDGVVHPGILRVELFTEHERGPALVFEHDPSAERLDLFLRRRGKEIDVHTRLDLLRQIAETLRFAHARRLYHRALSPRTVLVTGPDTANPKIKIFDWRTTGRDETSRTGTRLTIGDTVQPGLPGEKQGIVYLAPEIMNTGGFDADRLDIFSLGAVAYFLFSGVPPARDVEELHRRLSAGRGLRISDVLDGVAESIQELVEFATDPNVEDRPGSVGEFLRLLDAVEEELTAPEPEQTTHPLDARTGDRLEGGFVVKRRLGKGSTSVALLVERNDREGVLKVALEPAGNPRLTKEGAVLKALRHHNIVELYEQCEVTGHAALFMARAGADTKSGTYTLAERIREEGRLSLDLLQRFGDELLGVLGWLEARGTSHRDIKPDNIGVAGTRADKALTLVLFDFSLADTPLENIRAGTPPYLDPFLRLRRPPRWDTYAERFAAAMTLYEMATGQLPAWGDGRSDPSMLDCEATLDGELFDPAVREGLSRFFARGLARDYRARFDNAEDMRRAWFRVFEHIDRPSTVTDHGEAVDVGAILEEATEATPISALGLSARVLNALDRIGAHTLGELVRVPRIRLYRNKGIGQKTVKEIRELAERVAEHLAGRGERPGTRFDVPPEDRVPVDPLLWSVDLLAGKLVGKRVAEEEARFLKGLLGLDQEAGAPPFAPRRAVAERLGADRSDILAALEAARERWGRQPWMTALRDDVARLVDKHAGVMTGTELAAAVLSARGSVRDGDERIRLASAVAYAAVETEAAREGARFTVYRHGERFLVVGTADLGERYGASVEARARYAIHLGGRCDALAGADPLPAPIRVTEALLGVPAPAGDRPIPPDRLVRLGARVSERAALSSRMEIYPRGMPAVRALKLGMGSLLGPKSLTAVQIRRRIGSRYPEAEPVPGPPALDGLLAEAGIELVRDGAGPGYAPRRSRPGASSTTSTLHRMGTASLSGETATPETEDAWRLEERIRTAVDRKRFLVLGVAPRHLPMAERELLKRFPLRRMSIEALLIGEMKVLAARAGADWDVVLRADGAEPGSRDWRNLVTLVRRAVPAVERALLRSDRTVLVVHSGLLARYEQLDLLDRLRDAGERRGDTPGFLVLLPADRQTDMPVIDGSPLPVVLASQWARLTETWLSNRHRGDSGTESSAGSRAEIQ
ncbi:MAG: BREX system serine/threonine kinase PglW [Pseudomonadota bacterium]|nr:BREX system serine/threonine kinase PglW [Pseudomonadota bacterium]